MTQDSIIVTPPDLSPGCQGHPNRLTPPKAVARRYVRAKIPTFSVGLTVPLKPPEPEKRPIDKLLDRLAGMQFVGKDDVKEYLRHIHRRNCKPNTLRGALTACQLILSFIKDHGKTQLEQIGRQDLEGFVEHEQDRGLKIASVKTRLAAVYAFLGFLHDKATVGPELLVKKIRLRLPDPLPKAIDPDDTNKLLSVLEDVRDRAMILVLLRTGMRIGELLNTKQSDVNIAERKITIYEAEKNGVGRFVCVSDDALCALMAWMSKRDPNKALLFYGQGRSSLTYQGARSMFVKYLRKAGLSDKPYTLHCLRHTFATEMLNAGMRLECLQPLLGHSSIEVTRRYARLTDKTREQEYFKAMEIIEKGDTDGDYRLDS